MRKATPAASLRTGGVVLGLALLLGAVRIDVAHAEPAGAAFEAVQVSAPGEASGEGSGEVRALIGGDVAPSEAHDAIVRLGPADADWSQPDTPIGLPLVEMRGLNGRILWSHRRAEGGVSALAAVRPAPGDDLSCLTQAVYYEARSESLEGQQGVAQVVMNRAHVPRYGGGVCGAVYQRTGPYGTCQFTFVCDGSMGRRIEPTAWQKAQDVASHALGGFVYDPLKDAFHYHATWVSPNWGLEPLMRIGGHIFYP